MTTIDTFVIRQYPRRYVRVQWLPDGTQFWSHSDDKKRWYCIADSDVKRWNLRAVKNQEGETEISLPPTIFHCQSHSRAGSCFQ